MKWLGCWGDWNFIPYLVKRQDAAVAQTTFYRVAGLKSLANHWLRLYHTHKIWYRSADEGLIECGKAYEWFTDYFYSKLVTVCKGGHLRDTMQEGSRLSFTILLNNFILIIVLSFYILFLIPSFLIHPHKLFSMQLGPSATSLACARLIVSFALFNIITRLEWYPLIWYMVPLFSFIYLISVIVLHPPSVVYFTLWCLSLHIW